MEPTPWLSPHPRICVVVCGGAAGVQQGLSLLQGQNGCHDPIRGVLSREGRDLGLAFQAPPGSQASSRRE